MSSYRRAFLMNSMSSNLQKTKYVHQRMWSIWSRCPVSNRRALLIHAISSKLQKIKFIYQRTWSFCDHNVQKVAEDKIHLPANVRLLITMSRSYRRSWSTSERGVCTGRWWQPAWLSHIPEWCWMRMRQTARGEPTAPWPGVREDLPPAREIGRPHSRSPDVGPGIITHWG